MPTKQRRYPLKTKEAKQVLTEASTKLRLNLEELFGAKTAVEVIESDVGEIYIINRKPLLYRAGEKILPTLLFSEFATKAPKIIVDMGAVPYVCKGADVMAPGIVRAQPRLRAAAQSALSFRWPAGETARRSRRFPALSEDRAPLPQPGSPR